MDKGHRGIAHRPPRMLKPRKIFCFFGGAGWYVYLVCCLFLLMSMANYFVVKKIVKVESSLLQQVEEIFSSYFSLIDFNNPYYLNWLILGTLLCLTAFFPLYRIRKETRFIVQAYPEHLELIRGSKVIQIAYTQIAKIKLYGSGIGCGFKIYLKKGRARNFSTIIERAEYILESIMQRRPMLMAKEDYLKFRAKLIIADHKTARLEDLLIGHNRWLSLFVLFVLPFFIIAALFIFQSSDSEISSLSVYFGSTIKFVLLFQIINLLLFYTLSNLWIDGKKASNFAKGLKNKIRDIGFESRIVHLCVLLMIAINCGLYMGVYSLDINRFTIAVAMEEIPYLGIEKYDLQVIDTRYCQTCSLKVGAEDKVIFTNIKRTGKSSVHVGLVNAVPKQELVLNASMAKSLRSPASMEFTVPDNNLLIQYGRDGENFTLLGQGTVQGKIIDVIKPFK